MKKSLALLFLFSFLILDLSCSKSDQEDINIDQEILKEMEEQGIPSVVACVIKDDKIVWEGAYGYANIEESIPADRNSLYTIMSIGKLILSTAVFQLWEDNAIDLHEDINQYLPFEVRNPKYPGQKITPYMLLNHLSSLAWPEDAQTPPGFHNFYTSEDPPLIREWLPEYILTGGKNYRLNVWKDYAPGEKFVYSNIGTSLLALVVEEITGEDYRDYCRTKIFAPLEMVHTGFRFLSMNVDRLVTPYDDHGRPMRYYSERIYPAGFISCDLEDFSHFVIAMLNKGAYKGNKILNTATFDKMIELQEPISGTANLWVHCLGDCIGHLGGGTGFSTWVEWHPDNNRALFLFSNKVNGAISSPGRIYELVKYQAYKY
jgi:CubicO group peptidase (beta-lactamase class C family)